MKTDKSICPKCGAGSARDARLCTTCGTPLVLTSKGAVAVWRLGEVRSDVLDGIVRMIGKSLRLPVVVQPALLDPRPSRRAEWRGASATAFLNQVDRRTDRGTVFSLGITEENIVPGAAWNFLFGYAYLGQPSCVITLHQMSSASPKARDLVRRAVTIAIHEIGHILVKRLKTHSQALALPLGRRVGQPGHDVARGYLLQHLHRTRLVPFLGDSFQSGERNNDIAGLEFPLNSPNGHTGCGCHFR